MTCSHNDSRRLKREIGGFFEGFADATAHDDWAAYGDMFLPTFMNIDPTGAAPVARDDLVAFLPRRKGIFERAGATGTTLSSLDVRPLDDRHVIAETTWSVQYAVGRAPATPLFLHSTFLLRLEDGWRIVVYLNHNDLLELLGSASGNRGSTPRG